MQKEKNRSFFLLCLKYILSLFDWIFLALDIYIYENLTYFFKYKQRVKNEKESQECLFRPVSMNFICMRYEYLSNTLFTCQEPDLNWWHEDFQSSALPTELSRPFSVHHPSRVLVSMSMKRTKKDSLKKFDLVPPNFLDLQK